MGWWSKSFCWGIANVTEGSSRVCFWGVFWHQLPSVDWGEQPVASVHTKLSKGCAFCFLSKNKIKYNRELYEATVPPTASFENDPKSFFFP